MNRTPSLYRITGIVSAPFINPVERLEDRYHLLSVGNRLTVLRML